MLFWVPKPGTWQKKFGRKPIQQIKTNTRLGSLIFRSIIIITNKSIYVKSVRLYTCQIDRARLYTLFYSKRRNEFTKTERFSWTLVWLEMNNCSFFLFIQNENYKAMPLARFVAIVQYALRFLFIWVIPSFRTRKLGMQLFFPFLLGIVSEQ